MKWIVMALTALLLISYGVYRTARTEQTGFIALAAWVTFGVLDFIAIVGWAISSQFRSV